MVGNIDTYDGEQNLEEWIRMVERTAAFTGWNEDNTFKAALFRLRGEASEHIEQLREEGQVNDWADTKRALKRRFETSGKEQLYQHLLNTGTQGAKTVQEWAQVVRKLSLRALGASGVKSEREPAAGDEEHAEEGQGEATGSDATKAVLSFMRKTNFIRGLRSSLRQAVWRKKCETFDEAVAAATEEEAIELAHKEEEVLSCFRGNTDGQVSMSLVNSIVAALEEREAAKEADQKGRAEATTSGYRGKRPERQQAVRFGPSSPANYQHRDNSDRKYQDQLPLPRVNMRMPPEDTNGSQNPARLQRWPRTFKTEEERRAYEQGLCFACHQPGHVKRNCRNYYMSRPSGNGPRRLR